MTIASPQVPASARVDEPTLKACPKKSTAWAAGPDFPPSAKTKRTPA
jgi:hypothetical protein